MCGSVRRKQVLSLHQHVKGSLKASPFEPFLQKLGLVLFVCMKWALPVQAVGARDVKVPLWSVGRTVGVERMGDGGLPQEVVCARGGHDDRAPRCHSPGPFLFRG